MVKGKQKFPLMLVKLRFRVLFNFSTFVKFVRFPNQNNRKVIRPVDILANLKKIREIYNLVLFHTEFYGEFKGASCQFCSLGQKKL